MDNRTVHCVVRLLPIRALCLATTLGLVAPAAADDDVARRRYSTRDGSSGGLDVVDPTTGEPGSVRLSLVLDTVPADDFLHVDQDVSQSRQAVSVSWTPAPILELFGSLQARDTTSAEGVPSSVHAQSGLLGLKLIAEPVGPVRLGAGLRLSLPNDPGGQSPLFKASSIGLRGSAGIDLRDEASPTPFIARLNLGYLLDNSSELADDVENARYAALPDPLPRDDEDRHLLTRLERFGLDVDRTDSIELGLGVELPLELAERMYLHPLLETRFAFPVNRQGYDCPAFSGVSGAGEPDNRADACSSDAGAKAWRSNLALGVRVVPPVRGLSLALSVEIGLTGSSHFVREIAPNAPFVLGVALSYDYQPEPEVAVASAGPLLAPSAPAPSEGRVRGSVTDAATGAPIAGASVQLVGRDLGVLATDAEGRFVSYALPAGSVELALSHPDYEPGSCQATLPEGGADASTRCSLTRRVEPAPAPPVVTSGSAGTSSDGAPAPALRVENGQILVPALRVDAATGTLDYAAASALAELAELLRRDPGISRISVTGAGAALIRERLLAAGIEAARVEAADGAGPLSIRVVP